MGNIESPPVVGLPDSTTARRLRTTPPSPLAGGELTRPRRSRSRSVNVAEDSRARGLEAAEDAAEDVGEGVRDVEARGWDVRRPVAGLRLDGFGHARVAPFPATRPAASSGSCPTSSGARPRTSARRPERPCCWLRASRPDSTSIGATLDRRRQPSRSSNDRSRRFSDGSIARWTSATRARSSRTSKRSPWSATKISSAPPAATWPSGRGSLLSGASRSRTPQCDTAARASRSASTGTRDLDVPAIVACSVTPANRPEEEGAAPIGQDIEHQGFSIAEAHVDRAYVNSPLVLATREAGGKVFAKPWAQRPHRPGLFSKADFAIDLRARTVTCPAGEVERSEPGTTVHFDPEACGACKLRASCTAAASGRGRSGSVAEDEAAQRGYRRLQASPSGRAALRARAAVEHSLAHVAARASRPSSTACNRGQARAATRLRRPAPTGSPTVDARSSPVPRDVLRRPRSARRRDVHASRRCLREQRRLLRRDPVPRRRLRGVRRLRRVVLHDRRRLLRVRAER